MVGRSWYNSKTKQLFIRCIVSLNYLPLHTFDNMKRHNTNDGIVHQCFQATTYCKRNALYFATNVQ